MNKPTTFSVVSNRPLCSVITGVLYQYKNDSWQDLLTKVGDRTITYDDSGNPLTYTRTVDGETLTQSFTWVNGRNLESVTSENGMQTNFTYDADGIRTSKTAGGYRRDYVIQNGKVIRETMSLASTGTVLVVMDFIYDASGRPFAMKYRSGANGTPTTYYYVLNLQGDVVKLVKADGTIAAEYTYNAWGQILGGSGSMVNMNPLRYRGYYYDSETGYYYLQSRYYDPAIQRFINADSFTSTGQGFIGTNMFAYCNNSPVAHQDASGHSMKPTTVLMSDGGVCLEEPTSGTGSAEPFVEDKSQNIFNYNCLAYALGLDSIVILEGYESGYSIDKVVDLTISTIQNYGMHIRPIGGPDAPIYSNEYRIALCVGPEDYHFMVQHNDGRWSEKSGELPPALISADNPDNASWNMYHTQYLYYGNIVAQIRIVGITYNYYNSDIKYFAVSNGG